MAKTDENAVVEQGAAAAAPAGTTPFVKMFKEGVTLEVHPTCVASHEEAGWKVVKEG